MSDTAVVIYIVASMIILLVISLSVLWFFYYSQNKTIKLQMQEQSNKIQFQKELLINTVKTQETERSRISAELHDDIASRLSVIHLNINLLKKKVENSNEVTKIIDQIETSLDESIGRTRTISHELMPQLLKKFGFHYALHELTQSISAIGNIQLDVVDVHLCKFNDEMRQLHLFRILQELINNTIKYAKATNIKIAFSNVEVNEWIKLDYTDNGIGFNIENIKPGLGIYNIQTRAELLKGESKFINAENQIGLHFSLKFPNDEQ